jgi:hypothetical protein
VDQAAVAAGIAVLILISPAIEARLNAHARTVHCTMAASARLVDLGRVLPHVRGIPALLSIFD